ncbi:MULTISPECIES: hypothetical protein [Calothrix]|uniref:DUF928 domain-containing protein n=2 Tax=Calothrix TaxID=1186 RepID=A0ABR8A326_9CYAN|nr:MULTISPECIES: hypothetical protein [Calothrix]MBD2194300.1 hypothetical protein [Calothrix parietina FACHB-288]MBD2227064.1 hypothetical protein [Calothrix anomala FACHB-343]
MSKNNLLHSLIAITQSLLPNSGITRDIGIQSLKNNTKKASVVKFCLLLLTASSMVTFPDVVISPQTALSSEVVQTTSWREVLNINNLFQRRRRRTAARGNFCPISPGVQGEITQTWSDRPLFIWQGNIQTIGLRIRGSDTDNLWSQSVEAQQSVNYTGKKLQPGQIYEWTVYRGTNPTMFVSFQLMDSQKRDRITKELQTLETELQTKKANKEAIALAKAKYFAHQQLWSDVLQQAYSVSEPSDELKQIRQDIAQQLCNIAPVDNNSAATPERKLGDN